MYCYSFTGPRRQVDAFSGQSVQTISNPILKVEFDVEVRVSIFHVDSPTFHGNLLHSVLALRTSFIVGFPSLLTMDDAFRSFSSLCLGIDIVWQNRKDFARILGGKSIPQIINVFLRRLLLHLFGRLIRCRLWSRGAGCC